MESPNFGKSIKLFLADGTPTGIITAQIMNWTCRSATDRLNRRVEVKNTTFADWKKSHLPPDTICTGDSK